MSQLTVDSSILESSISPPEFDEKLVTTACDNAKLYGNSDSQSNDIVTVMFEALLHSTKSKFSDMENWFNSVW